MSVSFTIWTVAVCYAIYPVLGARLANDDEALSVKCPRYCVCSSSTIYCSNGFQLDMVTLANIPTTIEIITIDDFLIPELNDIFTRFSEDLVKLSCTNSRIRTVFPTAFGEMAKLIELSLHNNYISTLARDTFASLSALERLDLSGNLLEQLPRDLFINQSSSLRHLLLDDNKLQFLEPTLFDTLTHLDHLDLSHNELTYILPHTFSSLSIIRYIDLTDNILVTLHEDLFYTNNVTTFTHLSIAQNPLECNCGLVWLRETLLGQRDTIQLINGSAVTCANPHLYHGMQLANVPLEQLNCTKPTAWTDKEDYLLFPHNQLTLTCNVGGSPSPSVVWRTPVGDYITASGRGEWIDSSVTEVMSDNKAYKVIATGNVIDFTIKTDERTSLLVVNNVQILATGDYICIAMNPGGNATVLYNMVIISPIEAQFYPSLISGAVAVAVAILLGGIGCITQNCVEHLDCCERMRTVTYILKESADDLSALDIDDKACSTDIDFSDTCEENGQVCTHDELSCSHSSTSSLVPLLEISENTALTAEEWDDYFREYPDDFEIESCDEITKQNHYSPTSSNGSPRNTHKGGRTLETLENVRVRLKLKVEQMDVMKERLRVHMEKRSIRMRDKMAKRRLRMKGKMQNIKSSTSHSLQTIRETGRNYSHKIHQGVQTVVENVGNHVLSLKEFCGTGEMGQTMSIATIATDVDTNETMELVRTVTTL